MVGTKQAAELLGVSLPTLYRICGREDFPAVKFGRKIVIDETALQAWFRAHIGEDVLEGGKAE